MEFMSEKHTPKCSRDGCESHGDWFIPETSFRVPGYYLCDTHHRLSVLTKNKMIPTGVIEIRREHNYGDS